MLQININILEMNVSESRISVLNWKEQTPTVVSSSSIFFFLDYVDIFGSVLLIHSTIMSYFLFLF